MNANLLNKQSGLIILIAGLVGLVLIGAVFILNRSNQTKQDRPPDLTSNRVVDMNTKIDLVRALPMVQEFIKDVEKAKNGHRVSFRIEDSELARDEVVVVSETDDIKETDWHRFLVVGQTIAVDNPLTGEFESLP